MLDNDFRNPDLDRYVDRVFEHKPRVGIVGDAYDAAEAQSYVEAIRELEGSFPDSEFWTVDGWDDSGREADHVTVRVGGVRRHGFDHRSGPEHTRLHRSEPEVIVDRPDLRLESFMRGDTPRPY